MSVISTRIAYGAAVLLLTGALATGMSQAQEGQHEKEDSSEKSEWIELQEEREELLREIDVAADAEDMQDHCEELQEINAKMTEIAQETGQIFRGGMPPQCPQ